MKKEIIVISFVIIFIIILEIITNRYTDECIKNLSDDFLSLKEEIQNNSDDNEKLIKKLDEINESWDNYFNILAYYIEHNELEKLNTEITVLKSYLELQDYESAIPVIDKCNLY